MNLRGSRNERIHGMNGPAARFATGNQPSPFIGDGAIHSDDSPFEPRRQLTAEPFIEAPAPGTGACGQGSWQHVAGVGEHARSHADQRFRGEKRGHPAA